MNAIEVKNLSKVYKIYDDPAMRLFDALEWSKKSHGKDFHALDNVSFTVEKGKTLGIIGENGAGKSTLLKIITGVLKPTAGEITINGKISALLELGTGFNMEYTGIENIYLSGNINGLSREEIDRKVPEIVEFADIGDFINSKVKTYSSGMFARLAFAVAINIDPEILIVDEALSVGDLFFQQKCNLYMKEKMEHCTKLLVTHDMSSIANMADEAIVLSHGKQVFYGDPLAAIEFYTKSIHTNLFQEKSADEEEGVSVADDSYKEKISSQMIPIDKDALGGAMEVVIDAYRLSVNDHEYRGYVENDDEISVDIAITSKKDIRTVIIGYQMKDKYGNIIFGENTHSSGFKEMPLKKGKSYVANIKFKWPKIQENTYFLTLGVGEGTHEMQHVIQCWAHSICELKNINNLPNHGLFNQKIDDYNIMEV